MVQAELVMVAPSLPGRLHLACTRPSGNGEVKPGARSGAANLFLGLVGRPPEGEQLAVAADGPGQAAAPGSLRPRAPQEAAAGSVDAFER